MSRRKPAFCIYENKGTDQLHGGNPAANQQVCFRYIDSTPPLPNFKPLVIFCGCTAQVVTDLVGNPEDMFSHDKAQVLKVCTLCILNELSDCKHNNINSLCKFTCEILHLVGQHTPELIASQMELILSPLILLPLKNYP